MKARRRDYLKLLAAFICASSALSLIFSGFWWTFAAALLLNGAMCVAHGVTILRRLRVIMGLFFCLLGGVQLGILAMAIAHVTRLAIDSRL